MVKKRNKIACLLCHNAIKFPEYIGEDYKGDLLCGKCESLLRIKLVKGEVQEFTVVKDRWEKWKKSKPSKPSKTLIELQNKAREAFEKPEKNDKGGG